MAKSFRDLKVWEKVVDLAELVYRLTGDFPKTEIYGLSAQMRRAAVSTASNIAEGVCAYDSAGLPTFRPIAKGSNCELQTQLVIAGRLGFAQSSLLAEAEKLSGDVSQMLSGLATYLSKSAPNKTPIQ